MFNNINTIYVNILFFKDKDMGPMSRVVLHPKDKKSQYDIGLVIPCYDEGVGVLETIYSAAIDAERANSRIAVFLVVNNQTNCNERVLTQNRLTAKLIIDILRGKKLGHKKHSGYSYKQRQQIEKIRKSGITLGLVDCYSERNAPQECNVGYARDVGTRSILDFIESDDGVIAHTDADCRILRGYFQSINDSYFGERSEVHISRANTRFSFGKGEEAVREKVFWIENFEELMEVFELTDTIDFQDKGRKGFFTPGANHQYRKGIFQKLGGYNHIPGAEDVILGMKAQVLGYNIFQIPAKIETQCRFSERTQEGHGFGFEMKRKGGNTLPFTQTETIDYHTALGLCFEILQNAHQSDDFISSILESNLSEILPIGVVDEIIEIYLEYSWIGNEMKKYHITGILPLLSSKVRNELLKIHPRKNLYEVLNEVMESIDQDENFKEFTKKLKLNNINGIQLHLPSLEDEELLELYCKLAKEKLKTYILLKKVIEYFSFFTCILSSILENVENGEVIMNDKIIDLNALYINIVQLLCNYWEKIYHNLRVNLANGDALEKEISVVESMFETGMIDLEYINFIQKLSDLIESLNTENGLSLPHFKDALDFGEFFKRYVMS